MSDRRRVPGAAQGSAPRTLVKHGVHQRGHFTATYSHPIPQFLHEGNTVISSTSLGERSEAALHVIHAEVESQT